MIGKNLRKGKNVTTALNVLYAKKEKHILPMFQNITQIVKNKSFFFKWRKMALPSSQRTISTIKTNN